MEYKLLRIIAILYLAIHANLLHSQVPSYVPTNGLVGWWPFDGNANDLSGNGNNGAVNGPILTTDRFGIANKAYNFNPSLYQYININQNQVLNNLHQISISTWIFPNSNSSYNHMVNKSNDANLHQFILSSNNSGIYFYFGNGSSFFQTNTSPILNQWNHIVVTYSYGSGTNNCLIYLNGILTGSFVTTSQLQTTSHNLKFGSFGNNNINTVKGKLDDIGIWNRALTECEIQQLYLSQLNPLSIDAGPDMFVCSGDQITINATGASTYTWTGGIQNGVPFYPQSNQTYIVTGTNPNGCTGLDTVNVVVVPSPQISTSADTICPGDMVTLTTNVANSLCDNLSGSLVNGLVGYWPFCGNANDLSGNGNHGTVSGATLTSDRFGNANNAYSFDGLDDYIQTNKWMNGINNNWTISFWVKMYAQSQTPTEKVFVLHRAHFQDKDFMWNNNSIYISDRNGAPSNITSSVFAPDQLWHQVIVKSSNNEIKLYIDNNFISSVNRTVISDWDNSYYGSFFGGNGYDPNWHGTINGVLDDIGIWNRTLTTAEIQQLYNQGQTTLLWSPGGETTPTIIVSPTTTTNYTCTATTNGISCSESQTIEVLPTSSSNIVVVECNDYTLNGQTYTQSGIYTQVITNAAGCDSTITLDLTLNFPPVTPNIYVQNQTTLSTDDIPGLNYQWFFCTDLIDVPGATNPIFNPTANAYYAVVVSNACGSDTSACADVSSIGLNDFGTQNVLLYPNPTNSLINVIVPSQLLGQDWELMDIRGRLVLSGQVEKETTIIQISGLARGSYWLKIQTSHPIQVVKN